MKFSLCRTRRSYLLVNTYGGWKNHNNLLLPFFSAFFWHILFVTRNYVLSNCVLACWYSESIIMLLLIDVVWQTFKMFKEKQQDTQKLLCRGVSVS
jgi:hypothetical protein